MSKQSGGAKKHQGRRLHPASITTAPCGDPISKRVFRLDPTKAGETAAYRELRFLKKAACKTLETLPLDMPLGRRMLEAARQAEELLGERMRKQSESTLVVQPSI